MTSFVKGTFFLAFVILFSKLFGFIFRMQFMRIAGEDVVGIYMTAYPAFIFFISLIQIGLPIAMTKIIAELHANRDAKNVAAVLRTSFRVTTISIIAFMPILFFTIPYIASELLQNEDAKYPLIVALCATPVIVYGSLIRAFLHGVGKISMTAWSALIEQAIRIMLIAFLLPFALQENPAKTAAFAMFITALAELGSVLFLYYFYARYKPRHETKGYAIKPLFHIALPSAGSKLFGTFTWFLEPIIFLKALSTAGLTAATATSLYGIISGVHIPLLLFPAFVPAALSIVLVPAISEALAKQNEALSNSRIELSLRLSSIIGCYAATVFFLFGDELTVTLFHLKEKNHYMQMLAPIFYFYYIQSPLHSILQAANGAKTAMLNSIYGGIGKLSLMLFLAAQPALQMSGAILAIGFGVLVTSFLHIAAVASHPRIHLRYQLFALPYLCFIAVSCIYSFFPIQAVYSGILQVIAVVTIALFVTGQFKRKDFMMIRSLFSRL